MPFLPVFKKNPDENYTLGVIPTRNDCLWWLQSLVLVFPLTEVALTWVTLDLKCTQVCRESHADYTKQGTPGMVLGT